MSVAVLAIEVLGKGLVGVCVGMGVGGIDLGDRRVQAGNVLFEVRRDGLVGQTRRHVNQARPVVVVLWSPSIAVDLL